MFRDGTLVAAQLVDPKDNRVCGEVTQLGEFVLGQLGGLPVPLPLSTSKLVVLMLMTPGVVVLASHRDDRRASV